MFGPQLLFAEKFMVITLHSFLPLSLLIHLEMMMQIFVMLDYCQFDGKLSMSLYRTMRIKAPEFNMGWYHGMGKC
jgi:hypothetical protein